MARLGDWFSTSLLVGLTSLTTRLELVEDMSAEGVTRMFESGATPTDIAKRYPEYFIQHHAGIERLWETLNKREWRPFE